MSGRVARSRRRRWNQVDLGGHRDLGECADVMHAKYVSNARCRLLMFGPAGPPAVLECGCPFIVIRVEP